MPVSIPTLYRRFAPSAAVCVDLYTCAYVRECAVTTSHTTHSPPNPPRFAALVLRTGEPLSDPELVKCMQSLTDGAVSSRADFSAVSFAEQVKPALRPATHDSLYPDLKHNASFPQPGPLLNPSPLHPSPCSQRPLFLPLHADSSLISGGVVWAGAGIRGDGGGGRQRAESHVAGQRRQLGRLAP